ncbi:MAG: hypothetical protein STSR0008_07630 [Ignavibacterium sp.]
MDDTPNSNDTIFVMKKSPLGAVARSAIIPGWGQFYNHSYWKIPVVWGFLGWLGYSYKINNDRYNDNKKFYLENINDFQLSNFYKRQRDFYHDQRDLFAIYFFVAYFANLIDAYVDAHLFDFSVSEDLSKNSYQINLKINF